MRKSGQYSIFSLSYHILSTAGGLKKIAGKGGGVEYFIHNFYWPMGHVKSNVQSIRDIISFRIKRSIDKGYNQNKKHLVSSWHQMSRRRGHATKNYARGLVFLRFSYRLFPLFSLFVSLFLFSFYCAFTPYLCFGHACSLRQARPMK